jgi:hypothetical protein
MWARQRGATALGMLIILGILGVGLYAGMRLFPIYFEYMEIARAMNQIADENKNNNISAQQLRTALQRRWDVDDIKSISPKEMEIKAAAGMVYMRAEYRAEAPFIGNVSLVVDFDKTVEWKE